MKLTDEYLGVKYEREESLREMFRSDMLNPQSMLRQGKGWTEDLVRIRVNSVYLMTKNHPGHKIYLISQRVLDNSQLITYDKIDLKWFSRLKSMSATFILNKDEFFRFYVEEGKEILILYGTRNEQFAFYYESYSIDLVEGIFPMEKNKESPAYKDKHHDKKELFTRLLLFIHLTEVEYITVKPKQKIHTGPGVTFDNRIKNESGVDVILVKTDWNKVVVVGGAFRVSGHIRIQPYGANRSQYKLVWIDEYTKTGIIRRAGKETANE